ncbi:MAG: hypothetical protein ACREA4_04045 [Nitrososphaera sp.]
MNGVRHRNRLVFRPLFAILISYYLALVEIFMIRELEVSGLKGSYYPQIRKRQAIEAVRIMIKTKANNRLTAAYTMSVF